MRIGWCLPRRPRVAAPKLWPFPGALRELDPAGLRTTGASQGRGNTAAEDSQPTAVVEMCLLGSVRPRLKRQLRTWEFRINPGGERESWRPGQMTCAASHHAVEAKCVGILLRRVLALPYQWGHWKAKAQISSITLAFPLKHPDCLTVTPLVRRRHCLPRLLLGPAAHQGHVSQCLTPGLHYRSPPPFNSTPKAGFKSVGVKEEKKQNKTRGWGAGGVRTTRKESSSIKRRKRKLALVYRMGNTTTKCLIP